MLQNEGTKLRATVVNLLFGHFVAVLLIIGRFYGRVFTVFSNTFSFFLIVKHTFHKRKKNTAFVFVTISTFLRHIILLKSELNVLFYTKGKYIKVKGNPQ